MFERRQYSRIATRLKAELSFEAITIQGYLVDLSLGGGRFCTIEPTTIGSNTTGFLRFLTDLNLGLNGLEFPIKIARQDGSSIALTFDNANNSLRNIIFLKTIVALCGNEQLDVDYEFSQLVATIEDQLWNT